MLKNLIYIYQLENYDRKRFLQFVYKKNNWFKISKRGKLQWTMRAKLIFLLSLSFLLILLGLSFYLKGIMWMIVLGGIFFLATPLVIIFSDVLISPLVLWRKNQIVNRAKKILKNKKIKTIGITGSFGKTTCKNILATILSEQFQVLKTPGNINTDLGIANFIIQKEKSLDNYDFFVLEMSAYKKGDIAKICKIIFPQYSIITAIGLAHLERFGSLKNIIAAKFELLKYTTEKSFLNTCDENIKNNYKKIESVGCKIFAKCAYKKIKQIKFLDNFAGIKFTLDNQKYNTKLLAKHNLPLIYLAIKLAEELGENHNNIYQGVSNIKQIKHRLEVVKNSKTEVTVIDDSYNGNYQGFVSGIDVLSRVSGRKIVLTPGIVELGKEAIKIHQKIAQKYIDAKIDLVLLIDNKNTQIIKNYFSQNGFRNYKIYSTADKAHQDLVNILKRGDAIIFQNDLSDNY